MDKKEEFISDTKKIIKDLKGMDFYETPAAAACLVNLFYNKWENELKTEVFESKKPSIKQ